MNESVIIQKLIQVGQMLERGELEYSGAEADTKHILEQYAALRQPLVSGRSEQFKCSCGKNSWEYNNLHDSKRCMNCGLVQTNI